MKRYLGIELGRGLAAIWVLLHHAILSFEGFYHDLDLHILEMGHIGVELFFIISGFIILYAGRRHRENNSSILDYLSFRAIRIYVPYLPIGIGLLILYIAIPSVSASAREIGILSSFTLYPTEYPPALSVAWTLQHELLFYALFCSYFLSRPIFITVFGLWFCAILLQIAGVLTNIQNPLIKLILSENNLFFFLGMSIHFLPQLKLGKELQYLAPVVLLTALLLVVNYYPSNSLLVAANLYLFTYVLVCLNLTSNISTKWFLYLGAASYSVYLVHNPIQSIVVRIFRLLDTQPHSLIILSGIISVSLIAGLVYYAVFEDRAIRITKLLYLKLRNLIILKKCTNQLKSRS